MNEDTPAVVTPPEPQLKLKRFKLFLLITTAVMGVAALIAGGLMVHFSSQAMRSSAQQQEATEQFVSMLSSTQRPTIAELVQVESDLGFQLEYDSAIFDSFARVTDATSTEEKISGEAYTDAELKEMRSYSLVELTRKHQDIELLPTLTTVSLNTSIRKDFWAELQADPANRGKDKIDILTDWLTVTKEDSGTTNSQPASLTMSGIHYKKIVQSHSNERYGIEADTTDVLYMTVQNDRPYWIKISNASSSMVILPLYEEVIQSISYPKPDLSKFTTVSQAIENAKSSERDAPKKPRLANEDSVTPRYIPNVDTRPDVNTRQSVIASNQPSIVRILSSYCVKISLKSGEAQYEADNICTQEIGSGTLISSDGYIATSGELVTGSPIEAIVNSLNTSADVRKLFNYFVAADIVTQDQTEALITDLESGAQTPRNALAKVGSLIDPATLTTWEESYEYAVQISDEPLRVKQATSNIDVSYNDTVVKATLVGRDYDPESSKKALQYDELAFNSSNVALLKVDGSYPHVELGDFSSVTVGSKLTTMGFPLFTAEYIETEEAKLLPNTIFSTVGSTAKDNEVNGRNLLFVSYPIYGGNTGSPVFDENGKQIGISTYASIRCPDSKCFGDGWVRDITDLNTLLEQNNITLNTDGVADDWRLGLRAYAAGNYQKATDQFNKVASVYPANYLADSYAKHAETLIGSDIDVSTAIVGQQLAKTVFMVVAVSGLLSVVVLVFTLARLKRKV